MRIDLHAHSRVSDGTDSPTELVEAARVEGLDVVALTDHDTLAGLDEAAAAGERCGVEVVRGVEISCGLQGRSVHLLAYDLDESHPGLVAELARIRAGREGRLSPVLAKLEALGVGVTEEQVRAFVGDSPSVGRPHIADAMVAAGHVADRAEAFARYLHDGGPAHVPRPSADVGTAIDLVHDAGGRAVLAHPWGRGSRTVLGPDVLAGLVRTHDLDGIEVDHLDHSRADREALRALTRTLGVIATGSSDYHGTGKTGHPLGAFTTEPAMYERLRHPRRG